MKTWKCTHINCNNTKICLPIIDIVHVDGGGTYVSWGGSMSTSCNFFDFKYKAFGDNAFITRTINSSGDIYFPHELDEYTLSLMK